MESQDRLDRLTSRQTERTTNTVRYSKFVRAIQLSFPIIAVAIIGAVIFWSMTDKNNIKTESPKNIVEQMETPAKNELINPNFISRDEKDRPINITANRATQAPDNDNKIILENPAAQMVFADNKDLKVKAINGEYIQDTKQLDLSGNVNITHQSGYVLKTENIHVDMEENTAIAKTPVNITGPGGTIDATAMNANMQTEILHFNGPVKITILNGNLDILQGQ